MSNKIKKSECRIKHFPISFFSTILGLTGFTIATQKMGEMFPFLESFSLYILFFTMAFFIAITVLYIIKILFFNSEVKSEFEHPVALNFFPTFSISLLLLSIAFYAVSPSFSQWLWILGTSLHFLLTLKILSIWIQHSFEIKYMNPSWFIPAVGNILVPVIGVHFVSREILWFFFSVGLIFWVVLLVIFFNRIIFHHPLPQKLLPTLFILIAPPAVGFISLVKLTSEINYFSRILYYFGLFMMLALFFQAKLFYKIKFYLSWWAYSFPISAITIATILFFHKTGMWFYKYLAIILYGGLVVIIFFLLIKTAQAIGRADICVSEE